MFSFSIINIVYQFVSVNTCTITTICFWRFCLVVDSATLLTCNLADIVTKHDFVTDSKHLVTVLVIVPRQVCEQFTVNYWSLSYSSDT